MPLLGVLGDLGHQRPLLVGRGVGGGGARRQNAVMCIPDSASFPFNSTWEQQRLLEDIEKFITNVTTASPIPGCLRRV